jgi:NAD(P)-dependent dehydrogenase (short-subunit alcohol dehydrogenase family)
MQLAGKVALITGTGSGIGKATALLLAQTGVRIAAIDRNAEESQQTVQQIQQQGGEAISAIADVSQPEQMRQAIEQVVSAFGRIDIVFANAGINGVWAPIEDLQPDEWDT